ncbi:TetR/AcrR family transcriptional regulator [Amycolatopsis acidicola]|uniref:TetR/AcrR family transcriptional regulator n=1 Tax=Amycolatopsis acidicola TaxID=2596893 RepID=A0A5N0UQH6_9PSEU|nr:TetR/AcrR family transcriptional regulator [Amycolatopsis acidicola]KAA9149537.1 TetR/AcrR family transcriptional regulator [Amycolatopsis acidicola]
MTADKTHFPTRRAAAERNRDKILAAARAAFADGTTDISMAEVARRAGVGMATLYRNFPGRRELLEALYADEVDAICAAAVVEDGQMPGAALIAWLRLQFEFISHKRLIVTELLEHTDGGGPASRREQALEAGRPLLTAAQRAREIRDDITLDQVFDMIVAIAKIHGGRDYLEPVIQTMLDGLRVRPGVKRRW